MRTKNICNMDDKGLINNPATRLPVCICLDTSYSMFGEPINELNRGLRQFYAAIREDDIAKSCAEISIITFGNKVECIQSFSNLDKQSKAPTVYANGGTPMGEAVNLGLDLLEKRKEMYKENGIDYYQPWLVLMTDGLPNGSYDEFKKAVDKTTLLVNNKKLTVFPIMIGKDANIEILKRFSPSRMPVQLKGLKFKEFFTWLSKSIAITSKSTPGDSVPLDPIADWAVV